MLRFTGEDSEFGNKDAFAAKGVANPFDAALGYALFRGLGAAGIEACVRCITLPADHRTPHRPTDWRSGALRPLVSCGIIAFAWPACFRGAPGSLIQKSSYRSNAPAKSAA